MDYQNLSDLISVRKIMCSVLYSFNCVITLNITLRLKVNVAF